MLTTTGLNDIDTLVKQLSQESDKWMSLAIAIDLADEVLKVLLPNNEEWRNQLNRNSRKTGALPQPLPLDTFKNQKQVKWFNAHPESASARSAFKLFNVQDCALESNFFWFSESATKQKIAAAAEYSQNWEDSELTRKPQYKVGIDFFLTPEANSLLVVLSNHQKLRVLELHGHLSNTQKLIFKDKLDGAAAYTGIENGVQLEFEPQRTIHTTLWNALQLKEVNKQFYGYIAGHFKEVVDTLQSNGKSADDAKQFSSRLLGRLLFVWFLRKMDIINESVGYFDTDDLSATEYYEQKLKTLFFQTLNTEIGDRTRGDLVTPYLNGGLFEAKENDFANEVLEFPEDFFTRLFNHFDEFNFTTDESSADYELIAVDPEMLGQVFESLLASQIGEDDTNERNNTGSFYTPREIVGYMVKETLRQYLYSKLAKSTHKGIDELLDLSDSQWLDRKSTSNADVWGVNSKKVISEIKVALDNFKVLDPAAGSGAFPMGMLQQLLKTYERIETRFDPYKLKLSIIENNIFGIDLQPMAIEISRLRAWLSVIVDEEDKKNIKPLPNLEFKFITANSLIKLEKGQTDLFADPDLDVKLQDLRDKYFNARKHHTKKEYQEKYYKLTTGQISMFEDERTRQLKSFDPFKNRIAADFFDPHIMFGINDGFDAVIGNPPYIHFEKMEKTIRDFYKNNSKKFGFTTYAARGDMYTLFYEKGVQLLKEGGFLSFITSNKWMRAGYGEKLRDFFLKETNPVELIDLGAGMFESATVDTNILLLQKGENHHQLKALTLGEDGSENMSDYIRRHAVSIDYKVGESWTILSEIEQSIKKKIEAVGTPLKDWDIKINRGILTGLNEAFIISKEKRDELVKVDPKSAEIIRPILRGRDIKRYEVNFQNLYLINTHNGYVSEDGETVPPINVDDYPAIKDWLENGNWNTKPKLGTNIERLTKRTDQGVTPYNLRSLAYMDDFSKLKILFSEIVQSPQFYLDENNFIMNDTVTFISGLQLEYLVKYLNSRIIFSIYKSFYAGGGLGTNGIRVKKTFLQNLPIPKIQINSVKDEDIEKEVQEIIGLSSHEVHHLSEM
ncbi:class I SAM-dependent DNA methyltransferase [Enterococcus faecium]|uniref:Eco57I restriction-modification methylase domain-containing protein n=1 Tax=Enterococcus faecium TaxID=1352 RepID=UPI000F50FA45|nr:N-6 DNA methylase [Enterococcus faecium]MDK4439665.1 Eco57I restriction-modification methylase domain-containing protein [Enterococcus faecium]ROX35959.1 class I SAM-dependent DNA methyltransferase [Enterococcus faecium]ROX99881.1 class I SAM-dependent DNA methyltransferase [Enterococcus faecium]